MIIIAITCKTLLCQVLKAIFRYQDTQLLLWKLRPLELSRFPRWLMMNREALSLNLLPCMPKPLCYTILSIWLGNDALFGAAVFAPGAFEDMGFGKYVEQRDHWNHLSQLNLSNNSFRKNKTNSGIRWGSFSRLKGSKNNSVMKSALENWGRGQGKGLCDGLKVRGQRALRICSQYLKDGHQQWKYL